MGSDLYPGEVGCYASHLMVHRRILERQLAYALVLEDDAILADDCAEVAQKVVAALPRGWDIIHLSGIPTRAFKRVAEIQPAGAIVRYSRVPSGTVGYLISEQGAQKFLAPKMRRWPIDTDVRRPWAFGLDIYGIVPHQSSPIGRMALPHRLSGWVAARDGVGAYGCPRAARGPAIRSIAPKASFLISSGLDQSTGLNAGSTTSPRKPGAKKEQCLALFCTGSEAASRSTGISASCGLPPCDRQLASNS